MQTIKATDLDRNSWKPESPEERSGTVCSSCLNNRIFRRASPSPDGIFVPERTRISDFALLATKKRAALRG